jgi:ABC-2 type transport system ATP-binding protein
MVFDQNILERPVHERIDFLPEQPYFYQYLTAEKTLDFYARFFSFSRIERNSKIDGLLDLVGLSDDRKVSLSRFSRGMLQRIGIAQALLNDPDFVILDEPASGLDPIGQMEMRNLILRLKEEGKTILLSSHQLTEVEQICDYVSVLNRGHLIAEGDLDVLLTVSDRFELVFSGPSKKASEKLRKLSITLDQTDKQWVAALDKSRVYQALDVLKAEGADIISLSPKRLSLEEYFLQLIEEAR